MNPYFILILAALLAIHGVETAANWLNLKGLSQDLPSEFSKVFDAEKYAKSQDYTRERTKFEMAVSTADLLKILTFWLAGGFNWLDRAVRGLGLSAVWTGLLYVGALLALNGIFSLPADIYSTFVIEEKFGFNKTTWRLFAVDKIKGAFLTVLLGAPVLALILVFFERAGERAWVYAWAAASLFLAAIQFVAPAWIMPLFNKFTPLPEGELLSAIMGYAKSVNFSLRGIFVMDGSKRSAKTNAFFTGFGKNKRIALFDTLVKQHSTSELVSVLAHEIGHYKMGHVLKGMAVTVLQFGLLSYLLSLFIRSRGLHAAFFMEHVSVYAGLVFFGLLYAPVSFILGVFLQMHSRKNEFEADRYAVQTAGDPGSLIAALKTLSVANLSNLTPHPLYVFLKYTHPPVLKRIEALRSGR